MDYFNNQMRIAGLAGPEGEPIISCQVNLDKNFAFLEVSEHFCTSKSLLYKAQKTDITQFVWSYFSVKLKSEQKRL